MGKSKYYKWYILIISVVASFMAILDINIVTVALPKMMSHYGENATNIEWVMIAYTITYSIIILLTTYTSKKYGLKIPFIVSILFFLLGSALCGMAPSFKFLVLFRVIQAIGGAGLIPISLNLLAKYFEPNERGKAMGIWTIGIMMAPAIGPLLGGYFVDYVDWRMIFYINIPVGFILLLLTVAILDNDIPIKKYMHKFDYVGFIFIGIFLGTLLYVLNEGQTLEWNSRIIMTLEIISFSSLLLFLINEIFTESPIIDFRIFKNYNFVMGNIVSMVRSAAIFSSMFILPLFIENILNYNAMRAGILMIPLALAVAVVSPLAGTISDKIGPKYLLAAGMIILGYSNFALGNLSLNTSIDYIAWNQILRGIGIGLINAPVMSTVINSVGWELIPEASALYNVLFQVGASFGIAGIGYELVVRQVYHLNQFARDITQNSASAKSILNFLHNDLIRNAPSYFRYNSFPAYTIKFFDNLIYLYSEISSFGDVFVVLAYLCIIGLLSAILVKNTKYNK
jgi:EmrB/QacA subfamily drug resistance transporter